MIQSAQLFGHYQPAHANGKTGFSCTHAFGKADVSGSDNG